MKYSINNSEFEEVRVQVDLNSIINGNIEMPTNNSLKDLLEKYLLLTYFPNKFEHQNKLTIFYNRYYWFLKFMAENCKLNGYDAGLEQQGFKILEEAEVYNDIDWLVIEEMINNITPPQ